MPNGHFVISLDFELFWGLFDCRNQDEYGPHILGVQKAIPALLEIFDKYQVNATFATVGFLFAKDKAELNSYLPSVKPTYRNVQLSAYTSEFVKIGDNEYNDPYHFGYSLFELIKNSQHEMACHTFCHYFVSEPGQTTDQFKADLQAAFKIASDKGIDLKSIVFPRNQYADEYLKICDQLGLSSFRGTEQSWLYTSRSYSKESQLRRALRLMDAYVNISGYHTYSDAYMGSFMPINIPSSRFLRPYHPKLALFDGLRLNRIKKSMKYAAKNHETYHLWWHPHNFGLHLKENIGFLEKILQYYSTLKDSFAFENITMQQLAKKIHNNGK